MSTEAIVLAVVPCILSFSAIVIAFAGHRHTKNTDRIESLEKKVGDLRVHVDKCEDRLVDCRDENILLLRKVAGLS